MKEKNKEEKISTTGPKREELTHDHTKQNKNKNKRLQEHSTNNCRSVGARTGNRNCWWRHTTIKQLKGLEWVKEKRKIIVKGENVKETNKQTKKLWALQVNQNFY